MLHMPARDEIQLDKTGTTSGAVKVDMKFCITKESLAWNNKQSRSRKLVKTSLTCHLTFTTKVIS